MEIHQPGSEGSNLNVDDIILEKRGRGQVLKLNSKEYYIHVNNKKTSTWRCSNYAKTKCVGSLKISQDMKQILKYKEHKSDCMLNEKRLVAKKIITMCAEEAVLGQDTVPAVYKKVVSSFEDASTDFVANIPSFQQMSSTVYRHVNKHFEVKASSSTDAFTLEIPPAYSGFLLADCIYDDNRVIIFASKEARVLLKDIKTFMFDGTFKVCPAPFAQLYTMHGDLDSSTDFTNVIPLVYALVTNKTKETYIKMLELIKAQIPTWNPSEILTDFEAAAIAAIREVFPDVQHHGCYFHFSQALWKKAKKMKITDDVCMKRIVALCSVLPMLPENKLNEGWTYVETEAASVDVEQENFGNFIGYVHSYWMKNNFHKSWCLFGVKHRTTNCTETWHHTFRGNFKRTPPSFLIFLKKLHEDATYQKTHARKILAASKKNFTRRKTKYVSRDRYIEQAQLELISDQISIPLFMNKLIYLTKS